MPRIVIADDHPAVRRYVRAALEEKGWNVCSAAATGLEAVAVAAAERPDSVVLDGSMPEMNGLEAARRIREQSSEVAILILSVHDSHELAIETLAFGANACVLKTDLEQLV